MGGATCNHGQHKAPALEPHSCKKTCQAEQWQLDKSTSYNWICETDNTSNTQAHRDDNKYLLANFQFSPKSVMFATNTTQ